MRNDADPPPATGISFKDVDFGLHVTTKDSQPNALVVKLGQLSGKNILFRFFRETATNPYFWIETDTDQWHRNARDTFSVWVKMSDGGKIAVYSSAATSTAYEETNSSYWITGKTVQIT